MNAARPAVQLCCPYQSVKSAPSLATRSMFGVRYPMMPWLYALTLNQPMSSAMIMRMFGLRPEGAGCADGCCACARRTGAPAARVDAAASVVPPSRMLRRLMTPPFIFISSRLSLPLMSAPSTHGTSKTGVADGGLRTYALVLLTTEQVCRPDFSGPLHQCVSSAAVRPRHLLEDLVDAEAR